MWLGSFRLLFCKLLACCCRLCCLSGFVHFNRFFCVSFFLRFLTALFFSIPSALSYFCPISLYGFSAFHPFFPRPLSFALFRLFCVCYLLMLTSQKSVQPIARSLNVCEWRHIVTIIHALDIRQPLSMLQNFINVMYSYWVTCCWILVDVQIYNYVRLPVQKSI